MFRGTVFGVTILTYGTNFWLYLFLKTEKKKRSLMEKGAIFFAANMSLFLVDAIIMVFMKMISDMLVYD